MYGSCFIHTGCLRWCMQHTFLWVPHLVRSNERRRGPLRPSAWGSLQTYLCRCSQRTFPRCEVLGSSTKKNKTNSHNSSDLHKPQTQSAQRLKNLRVCVCVRVWLTWAIFTEFCVAPPAWYSTLNFFTSSSNLHTETSMSFFLLKAGDITQRHSLHGKVFVY